MGQPDCPRALRWIPMPANSSPYDGGGAATANQRRRSCACYEVWPYVESSRTFSAALSLPAQKLLRRSRAPHDRLESDGSQLTYRRNRPKRIAKSDSLPLPVEQFYTRIKAGESCNSTRYLTLSGRSSHSPGKAYRGLVSKAHTPASATGYPIGSRT